MFVLLLVIVLSPYGTMGENKQLISEQHESQIRGAQLSLSWTRARDLRRPESEDHRHH